MVAVSIILPVYNVSKYLDRCIVSIIAQSYKDFEVVIINDGSTDNSGSICDKWASSDDRISVFHIENGGVAMARNLGISKSSGEYLYFVDPDDWLAPTTLGENFHLAAKYYDIVIFGYQKQTLYRDAWINSNSDLTQFDLKSSYEIEQTLVEILRSGARFSIWNKLFKRSFILQNEITFPRFKRGQDIAFTLDAYKLANSLIVNPKIYYFQQAFNTLEKFNPEGVQNHAYFADTFFKLFPNWMEKPKNYEYFLKMVALWFFHVIPSMIVNNTTLTKKQKLKSLAEIFENNLIVHYINKADLRTVRQKSIRVAFRVLKSRNALLLYHLTVVKKFVFNNFGNTFFRKSFNSQ